MLEILLILIAAALIAAVVKMGLPIYPRRPNVHRPLNRPARTDHSRHDSGDAFLLSSAAHASINSDSDAGCDSGCDCGGDGGGDGGGGGGGD